ncbi:hypothetical protein [Labilibaculum antarcticum]|uniref:Cellobiose phosphorylase n=1 Tax=Labilibaculum antarcticum TaxID=1717717 RepID=A0A1Y1CQE3_9BACT|nr:hypothetical protein [Labilibaculum antarcticum]BAX82595.1 hypothetical protein ALGA_4305 [Labilibaculum antarcticum]
MKKNNIYLGDTSLNCSRAEVEGEFVELHNEKFYKISNSDQMSDFFMSIVSDSDHWMFISSNGSLSAGRKDRNSALFPYYTVDKIHDYRDKTGSKTIVLVEKNEKTFLWKPFSDGLRNIYKIERNLYKSMYGNKVIFEEVNLDLGMSFQYGWNNSEKFGWVKKSKVSNLSDEAVKFEILDGIENILPYGLDYDFQNEYSNLLDAYKKSELLAESGLGLYMLSSIPVDRAEPSESLNATTVWSHGLDEEGKILLSSKQFDRFKDGLSIEAEFDVRATKGAYILNAELELGAKDSREWIIVAEVNQTSADVANLNNFINTEKNIFELVSNDIALGTKNLIQIVADADGLQMGNDDLAYARHFSNTLFNVMRGGIFTDNYLVGSADFKLFVYQTNKLLAKKFEAWIDQLPSKITYAELNQLAEKTGNSDLIRICYEYLPLTFSRRHGDPSRPWNQFSIETKNDDGSPKLTYQGNWRDIFQNWEALGLSYPEFIEGMIGKFVNASTADGYNPYRITREGIDWECPDPNDPWAYIGYWGDHQVIYLQKFLELSNEYHPQKLDEMLSKENFVYANVPYRIKSYKDIVKNPKDTIEFDFALNDQIRSRVEQIGADARMLTNGGDQLYEVNLTEKILVTLLAKLSNFIPEAGIWLNTQRPEWNDANNALVGNGVSMVTLCYLRRFLKFWTIKFNDISVEEIRISEEVKTLLDSIFNLFTENASLLEKGFSDEDRRRFADVLGEAGTTYRNGIYANSFSGVKKTMKVSELLDFTNLALVYMDQSIKVNKREDGLYHAYNLISFTDKTVSVRYLYEMLEGQVAVLSSGYLSADESLDILDSLKASALFRQDQYSYFLYPNRQLPLFAEKNNIPAKQVKESKLLSQLIADQDPSILNVDNLGGYHFNGTFRNAQVLEDAINNLNTNKYGQLVEEDKKKVLGIFEEMFDHQSFTGRSGTFYGFEGLGSIYWHMVSKLLLATQESYFNAIAQGADPVVIGKIKDHYYEIKAGIGLYKSPKLYGAFPTDAYSHTPSHAGAQQPGMTGQVKEDFISRIAELGIQVRKGEIVFGTSLFNDQEMLNHEELFVYYDVNKQEKEIAIHSGQLAFTYCKVPVIYTSAEKNQITIAFKNGETKVIPSNTIDGETSALIFNRSGEVERIDFSIGRK